MLIPLFTIVAALILLSMGFIVLLDVSIPSLLPIKQIRAQGVAGYYLYGVAYGLASSGCTAPIFISILFFAISRGVLGSIITFFIYAVGAGIPLLITCMLVSKSKELVLKRIQRSLPLLHKISGLILIGVGLYLIAFYLATY